MHMRSITALTAAGLLLGLPGTALANHCFSQFTTDVGPSMEPPTGGLQTFSGDCTGNSNCSDYFDIVLAAGDQISVGFCGAGGSASFPPDLSIFSGGFRRSCNTSFPCSAGPQTTFVAPSADTYRIRIGHNFGNGGPYTLTYTAPRSSEIVGAIPVCFEIDAVDDSFTVINDGSIADFPVLANDECDGDRPISVVKLAGDLNPDRGGVAITDGEQVQYGPASGFVGFEEFSYTARDAGLEGGDDPPRVDQDTARVIVSVLEDLFPDAVDDAETAIQSFSTTFDVLANDTFGNEPHVVELTRQPDNGFATLQSDDTIRYRSNFNFIGEDSFEYRLTDANGDSDTAIVTVGVFFRSGEVPIDIMPNDSGNNVNLRAGPGSGFEVAVLSVGEFFDAPGQVDPYTLKLGPRQGNIWGSPRVRDVNGDGFDDLVVKFLTQQTGIACGDTSARLIGRTFDSASLSGTDSINTFNCPRVRKRH